LSKTPGIKTGGFVKIVHKASQSAIASCAIKGNTPPMFVPRKFHVYLLVITFALNASTEDDFIQHCFDSGDLVFDIGANIGTKTDLYLRNGANVICVEPQPFCVDILRKKYSSNSCVTIENKCLSDQTENIILHICTKINTSSTCSDKFRENRSKEHGYSWDSTLSVPTVTLDALIEQYGLPTFCKIDVEGFEFNVLHGLSRPINCISFEYTIEMLEEAEKCLEVLERLGYKRFCFTIGEHPAFIGSYTSSKNLLGRIQQLFNNQESQELNNIIEQQCRWFDQQKRPLIWGDIYAWL
jgi:FkbM family methyltransferase